MQMLAHRRPVFTASVLAVLAVTLQAPLGAQQPAARPEPAPAAKLVAEPATVTLRAGQTATIRVRAYDAAGKEIPNAFVQVRSGDRTVRIADTTVTATTAGRFEATAFAAGVNGAPITLTIPITVSWPALTRLELAAATRPLYAGLTSPLRLSGFHADGSARGGLAATWRTSDAKVATVNRFGDLTALAPGAVTVTAEAEGVRATQNYTIAANPVARLELGITESQVRTGDVIHLKATARRANGAVVADAPITWSYTYAPDDSIAPAGLPGGAGSCSSTASPRTIRAATPSSRSRAQRTRSGPCR